MAAVAVMVQIIKWRLPDLNINFAAGQLDASPPELPAIHMALGDLRCD
jgi:hypothetical protein